MFSQLRVLAASKVNTSTFNHNRTILDFTQKAKSRTAIEAESKAKMSGASWDRLPQEIRQQIIKEYLNSIFEDKFDNYYHMPYGYLWHGVNHHTTAVFSSVGYAFGAECRLPLEQMLKFLREENDYYIGRQAQLKEAIDHNKLPRVPVPSGGSQIAPHARPGYDRARHELLEMRQRIVPYGKVIRREYMDSYLGDDAVLKIFLRAVTLLTRVLDRLKRQQVSPD